MKHGGDLTEAMAEHGGTPEMWLDLSTGINPWPYPLQGIPDAAWIRLPSQADHQALLDAARRCYRVPEGADIVAAAGTQALIQWLPFLAAAGPVAIIEPTYGEHALAWRNAGREVLALQDLDALPADARHVVLVNPNNPDGRIVDRGALARVAEALGERGGWLVIDEAFADVDPGISAVALCRDLPIVILRSFGKFYGLAGIRLGFAISTHAIAQRIAQALGPWSCSGPALRIGTAALGDPVWANHARDALQRQARQLDEILANAGCESGGGTGLFRLVRHADALQLHGRLARCHIWCRRFDWADDLLRFGLPPNDVALVRLAAALASSD